MGLSDGVTKTVVRFPISSFPAFLPSLPSLHSPSFLLNMASKHITFAKGPSPTGFQRPRTVSPPIADEASTDTLPFKEYPVDKPSTWNLNADFKPGRPYYNMKLEDFPPYKALGEPLRLQGPEPYRPQHCGCDRYRIAEGMCVCSMESMRKPLYAWALANPEAFAKKQAEMHHWYQLSQVWLAQKDAVSQQWESRCYYEKRDFVQLQDKESPIGCASCERWGSQYCKCECDNCGSKYCCGMCLDDTTDDCW